MEKNIENIEKFLKELDTTNIKSWEDVYEFLTTYNCNKEQIKRTQKLYFHPTYDELEQFEFKGFLMQNLSGCIDDELSYFFRCIKYNMFDKFVDSGETEKKFIKFLDDFKKNLESKIMVGMRRTDTIKAQIEFIDFVKSNKLASDILRIVVKYRRML